MERKALRFRMESDHNEGGLQPLDVYFAWCMNRGKDYPPEMIREVYAEVVRKINGGGCDG